jgi:hypothetical protein
MKILPEPLWKQTQISKGGTYHTLNNKPLYTPRFRAVQKYHAPGIAPVIDDCGAYHIDITGKPIYSYRYLRTFGFYEDKAAVHAQEGFFHILPDGTPLYTERYEWCGNYQEGRCTVRCRDKRYYHLNENGEPAYAVQYRYVGDFRDGIAVVQRDDGLHSHIDLNGQLIHGHWFLDLDVFHKGFARGRDSRGWHHIDVSGQPIYEQRFAAVEPFYNGQARVECFDGALEVIDESGHTVLELRSASKTLLQQLSGDMVGFWRTQTIRAAVELGVFETLPATTEEIALAANLIPTIAKRLLRGLWELDIVQPSHHNVWLLTTKGKLLTRSSDSGMDAAARIWGDDHYRRWLTLSDTLRGFKKAEATRQTTPSYFEQLAGEPLEIYHRAISGYARHDYATLSEIIDWKSHQSVIDAGGSQGTLLFSLLAKVPHLSGSLIDLPSVVQGATVPEKLAARCRVQGVDLFESWPIKGDAIILARVLHDWADEQAKQLLLNATEALKPGGRIYIIEMVLSDETPDGGLLDINMLVITGGRERTIEDWNVLLATCQLQLIATHSLSEVSTVLVAKMR